MSVTTQNAKPMYDQLLLDVNACTKRDAMLKILVELGYTTIRNGSWAGASVVARDESGIPVIVTMDCSQLDGGYPAPRLTEARAGWMQDRCSLFLQDNTNEKMVRSDYVCVPDVMRTGGYVLPVTRMRGVSWGFVTPDEEGKRAEE